jgi:NAD(P)-dependent dehydrogenase (short-subunit alcohol dehydrogenase family)
VDYVVEAMDFIAHKKGLDGKCFHLTDPNPYRIGEVLNIFCKAGHAPMMSMRVNARMFGFIPPMVLKGLGSLAPVKRIVSMVLKDLGVPKDTFQFINWPTRYDNRETEKVLKGSGIKVPDLETYAPQIWDYWERKLDPDLFVDHSLSGRVKNKVVVVTGSSSGIGKATAIKLAGAGAKVILVARHEDKLLETKAEIEALGGKAFIYTADVSDLASCDSLVARVLKDHGTCDYLINNAGRSIRPAMMEQKRGQVINISSIGVLTNAPRFSAYVASKAALDAYSRCAASEFADNGISFTSINMPLVRTPMIAPTKIYEHVPTISPEEAADMVVEAIIHKPARIATRLGTFAQVCHAVAPKLMQVVMNTAFRMFPDSSAAKGDKPGEAAPAKELTPEQMAFAQIMQGVHW